MAMTSIIYLTNRIDPRFEWFVDSLFNQTTEKDREEIELIFIDYPLSLPFDHNEISRKELLKIIVDDRFKYVHAYPKPNIYQGEFRKTKGEYFSTSNARNTGVILSTSPYIVFVDDVSVLMPGWWTRVKHARDNGLTVCGSYQKHFEMNVDGGNLVSSRYHKTGDDSRRGHARSLSVIPGGSLFGCSLAIPLHEIMLVNGFDELCDSIGGEDYQFGIRLNHAGRKIYYDPLMMTIESEELHNQPYLMQREDRVLPEEKYMERLNHYGVSKRHHIGNWDSSHMILDILYGLNLKRTFYNNYDLAVCHNQKTFADINDQDVHWFDEKRLNEML